jgi:hypothetical protein
MVRLNYFRPDAGNLVLDVPELKDSAACCGVNLAGGQWGGATDRCRGNSGQLQGSVILGLTRRDGDGDHRSLTNVAGKERGMSRELSQLIESARKVTMSDREKQEQRLSFASSNTRNNKANALETVRMETVRKETVRNETVRAETVRMETVRMETVRAAEEELQLC